MEVIRLRILIQEFFEGFFNIVRQSILPQFCLYLLREWSDFYEKIITHVSEDNKVTIKLWRQSTSGFPIRSPESGYGLRIQAIFFLADRHQCLTARYNHVPFTSIKTLPRKTTLFHQSTFMYCMLHFIFYAPIRYCLTAVWMCVFNKELIDWLID